MANSDKNDKDETTDEGREENWFLGKSDKELDRLHNYGMRSAQRATNSEQWENIHRKLDMIDEAKEANRKDASKEEDDD